MKLFVFLSVIFSSKRLQKMEEPLKLSCHEISKVLSMQTTAEFKLQLTFNPTFSSPWKSIEKDSFSSLISSSARPNVSIRRTFYSVAREFRGTEVKLQRYKESRSKMMMTPTFVRRSLDRPFARGLRSFRAQIMQISVGNPVEKRTKSNEDRWGNYCYVDSFVFLPPMRSSVCSWNKRSASLPRVILSVKNLASLLQLQLRSSTLRI